MVFKTGLVCTLLIILCNAFPDGAPPDTCVKDRFNQPNHGQSRSQPLETIPYQIVASSAYYEPGQTISLTISGNDLFRGFFFQARDPTTQEWIGEFVESPNTKAIPECASVTHADNRDKTQAVVVWKAPDHKQGQVFFTGTVLKDYKTFWSNIVAQISQQ
ncbi:unnamed protein product [Chironomus riparius]|uniref:Reelin domain-containing protein n=1 Tax=Chironomus riparius TaxID=315576 RepID=A0A9N9S228_9DIPT|nr:unnamed protein product [Chironomus riparius]